MDDEELIKKIFKIQFEKGWTQKQIAEAMQLTEGTVNRILNKKYNISPVTRRRLIWFIESNS